LIDVGHNRPSTNDVVKAAARRLLLVPRMAHGRNHCLSGGSLVSKAPVWQWVLLFSFQLRTLFAVYPELFAPCVKRR
jgi:hypothetical protein